MSIQNDKKRIVRLSNRIQMDDQGSFENLKVDAARYRYICNNKVSSHSLHMDGTSEFRINTIYGRARTFDQLIDNKIKEIK